VGFIVLFMGCQVVDNEPDPVSNDISNIMQYSSPQDVSVGRVVEDNLGSVFAVGRFRGTVNFNKSGGSDRISSVGGGDAFVTKMDADGKYSWTITFGGTGNEFVYDIDFDNSNDIYVIGAFENSVDFDFGETTDIRTSAGQADIYVIKISADGEFVWVRTIGTSAIDTAGNIGIDSSGDVFYGGYFEANIDLDPTAGTDNFVCAKDFHSFFTKLDSEGNYLFSRTIGGGEGEGAGLIGLSVTSDDDIIVCGNFQGTIDFDPSGAVDNKTSKGSWDIYVSKFNNDGTYVSTVTFGGTGYDANWDGMDIDANDNVYIPGDFEGTVDFNPGIGIDNKTSTGTFSGFMVVLASDLTYVSSFVFGGSGASSTVMGSTVDANNNLYIFGINQGAIDLDPTTGSSISSYGSTDSRNAFVTVLDDNRAFKGGYTIIGKGNQNIWDLNVINNTLYGCGYIQNTGKFSILSVKESITSAGGQDGFIFKAKL